MKNKTNIDHFHVPYSHKDFKHDKYTCLCGFETENKTTFNKHLGKTGELIYEPVSVTEK